VRYSLWSGRMRCDHAQTFEDHTFSTPNMQVNVRVLTYDLNQAPSISGTCGRALPNTKRCQDLQLALFRAEQIAIRNAIASWFNGRPNLSAQHLDYFYRYEWIREQNKWLHAREEALKRS
jgi:hypothetical protein